MIAGLEDDGNTDDHESGFPPSEFKDDPFSPTFPETRFSPPDSFSTNSSDDEQQQHTEGKQRGNRAPFEVGGDNIDDDDDDEMGEMVGPSVGSSMMAADSDDEDEAIINESLGYPSLGANRFKEYAGSPYGGDNGQNDSSDGEEEGLVEILVPGRKNSMSS